MTTIESIVVGVRMNALGRLQYTQRNGQNTHIDSFRNCDQSGFITILSHLRSPVILFVCDVVCYDRYTIFNTVNDGVHAHTMTMHTEY